MKYAIKYYSTPEELADKVARLCWNAAPRNGYKGAEYYGAERLDDIAAMIEALRDGIDQNEKLQLADEEQAEQVSAILEDENDHTANIAFQFLFGNASDALRTVHYMGQVLAITEHVKYPSYAY